jgi:hypothetical protein
MVDGACGQGILRHPALRVALSRADQSILNRQAGLKNLLATGRSWRKAAVQCPVLGAETKVGYRTFRTVVDRKADRNVDF